MSDIKKIKDEFLERLNEDLNIESVNEIKSELFGKHGKISTSFKKLGSLPAEERKKFFASDLNFVKDESNP
jgi:phenylalanyl-tRNA synthetase alpha chain